MGGRQWKINVLQLDLVGKYNFKMKIKKAILVIFENVQLIQKFWVRILRNKVEKKVIIKKLIKKMLLNIKHIQKQIFFILMKSQK